MEDADDTKNQSIVIPDVVRPSLCSLSWLPRHWKHVACSPAHCVFITRCGAAYAFGSNGSGRLGIEDCRSTTIPLFVPLPAPARSRVCTVAVNDRVSVFLSDNGRVLCAGSAQAIANHLLRKPFLLPLVGVVDVAVSREFLAVVYAYGLAEVYLLPGHRPRGSASCSTSDAVHLSLCGPWLLGRSVVGVSPDGTRHVVVLERGGTARRVRLSVSAAQCPPAVADAPQVVECVHVAPPDPTYLAPRCALRVSCPYPGLYLCVGPAGQPFLTGSVTLAALRRLGLLPPTGSDEVAHLVAAAGCGLSCISCDDLKALAQERVDGADPPAPFNPLLGHFDTADNAVEEVDPIADLFESIPRHIHDLSELQALSFSGVAPVRSLRHLRRFGIALPSHLPVLVGNSPCAPSAADLRGDTASLVDTTCYKCSPQVSTSSSPSAAFARLAERDNSCGTIICSGRILPKEAALRPSVIRLKTTASQC